MAFRSRREHTRPNFYSACFSQKNDVNASNTSTSSDVGICAKAPMAKRTNLVGTETSQLKRKHQSEMCQKVSKTCKDAPLIGMLNAGYIKAGKNHLVLPYKDVIFTADLGTGGEIFYKNEIFATLSGWALKCIRELTPKRAACCGWACVKYSPRGIEPVLLKRIKNKWEEKNTHSRKSKRPCRKRNTSPNENRKFATERKIQKRDVSKKTVVLKVVPKVSKGSRRVKTNHRLPVVTTSYRRYTRCKKCEGCTRKNCGKCVNCLDMPRFGGSGVKRQACLLRACMTFKRAIADSRISHSRELYETTKQNDLSDVEVDTENNIPNEPVAFLIDCVEKTWAKTCRKNDLSSWVSADNSVHPRDLSISSIDASDSSKLAGKIARKFLTRWFGYTLDVTKMTSKDLVQYYSAKYFFTIPGGGAKEYGNLALLESIRQSKKETKSFRMKNQPPKNSGPIDLLVVGGGYKDVLCCVSGWENSNQFKNTVNLGHIVNSIKVTQDTQNIQNNRESTGQNTFVKEYLSLGLESFDDLQPAKLGTNIVEVSGYTHSVVHAPKRRKCRKPETFEKPFTYKARCVVATFPLGVLKQAAEYQRLPKTQSIVRSVNFSPKLSTELCNQIMDAPLGNHNKLIVVYDRFFWSCNQKSISSNRLLTSSLPYGSRFLSCTDPRYGSILNLAAFGKKNMICVHLFEPYVSEIKSADELTVAEEFDRYFRLQMFKGSKYSKNAKMVFHKLTKWHSDPFSLGSYSEYSSLSVKKQDKILSEFRKPHCESVFFAGEHTADANGTVVGAFESGGFVADNVHLYLQNCIYPLVSSCKSSKKERNRGLARCKREGVEHEKRLKELLESVIAAGHPDCEALLSMWGFTDISHLESVLKQQQDQVLHFDDQVVSGGLFKQLDENTPILSKNNVNYSVSENILNCGVNRKINEPPSQNSFRKFPVKDFDKEKSTNYLGDPKQLYDVIVIGAGVSGIRAAADLRNKRIITSIDSNGEKTRALSILHLEARNTIGGRVCTKESPISINSFTKETENISYDLGANYIHGFPPHKSRNIPAKESDKTFKYFQNVEQSNVKVANVDNNVWEPLECATWLESGITVDQNFVLLVARTLGMELEKLRKKYNQMKKK